MLAIFNDKYGDCACDNKETCFVESLKNEMDETGPSSVEPDFEKLSISSTDSMNEENPREIYHRPSIPPSPAESVQGAGVSNQDAFLD
jgi:hypothetical protein